MFYCLIPYGFIYAMDFIIHHFFHRFHGHLQNIFCTHLTQALYALSGNSPLYRVRRENFDTAHRKVDGIEMNLKVPYRLAIFAIIIEILIFEIVLIMRARRETRGEACRAPNNGAPPLLPLQRAASN